MARKLLPAGRDPSRVTVRIWLGGATEIARCAVQTYGGEPQFSCFS